MVCEKKIYTTRGQATRAAMGSSKTFGKGIRIYGCKECHGFHLTSRPASWSKRPRSA